MPTTKLDFATDVRGFNAYAPSPSNSIQDTTLEADVAQEFKVPTDSYFYVASMVYQPGSNVFIAFDDTASVPGSTVSSTTSEYLPAQRMVIAGSTISAITPDTNAYVSISFYAIKPQ